MNGQHHGVLQLQQSKNVTTQIDVDKAWKADQQYGGDTADIISVIQELVYQILIVI